MKRPLAAFLAVLLATAAEAQCIITKAEGTASETRIPIYLVDATDDETPETGITLTTTECQVSENGASFANCTGTTTEVGNGLYYYTPAAAEIDTTGFIVVKVNDAAANVFMANCLVRPFDLTAVYDGLLASESATTLGLASGGVTADDQYNNGFQIVVFNSSGAVSASSCITDSVNSGDTIVTREDISALVAVNDNYVIRPDAGCAATVATNGIVETSFQTAAITARVLATDAIGAAEVASDAVTEVGGGAVGGVGAFVNAGAIAVFSSAVSGTSTNTTTTPVTLNERFTAGKAVLIADYTSGAGATFDATLQHSPDGTNWFDYGTFAQVGAADTAKEITLTTTVYPRVRIKYTVAGTSPVYASITVELWGYLRP